MSEIDFDGINQAAARDYRSLLSNLIPGGKFRGKEYVAKNPRRNDQHPGSFSINFKTGVWKDFSSGDGGNDLISLVAFVHGIGQGEAARELAEKLGVQPYKTNGAGLSKTNGSASKTAPQAELHTNCAEDNEIVIPVPVNAPLAPAEHFELGKPTKTWTYTDATGATIGYVYRFDPPERKKVFRPLSLHRIKGELEWRWESWSPKRPLYGLRELAERPSAAVVVCEGEKAADAARRLLPAFVVVTSPHGSESADKADCSPLRGRDVIVWPDADASGHEYAQAVTRCVADVGAKAVAVVSLPSDADNGWDAADALDEGWTPNRAAELIRQAVLADVDSSQTARLRPLDLNEFLQLSIKPREMLLDPILPEKGLLLLYAARGTGKTHVALGICFAIATGTKFLKWSAPKPRRALLIDGEMPAAALQERLATIVANAPDVDLDPDKIRILAGDLIEAGGIGNLASSEVQEELDRWLAGIDVLILDNLSSLTAVIRDNDAESWGPIQEWLLKLRRRGISVVIVHHAGKGGQQRGTSRREDVLDTSISLRHPADYSPVEGARFEVHLEKARGVHGDAARPFEAKLEIRDGKAVWTTRELEDANRARVQALLDDGLTVREVADETGIPKSTVHRIKKAIEAIGGDHAE